jgi:hypothetical protein
MMKDNQTGHRPFQYFQVCYYEDVGIFMYLLSYFYLLIFLLAYFLTTTIRVGERKGTQYIAVRPSWL